MRLGLTPPIGYNEQGEPIEEVVTTATRIRAGGGLFGVLIAIVGLAYLGHSIGEELRLQPHIRRRQIRARRRPRRRR